jgi:hypothetical protein
LFDLNLTYLVKLNSLTTEMLISHSYLRCVQRNSNHFSFPFRQFNSLKTFLSPHWRRNNPHHQLTYHSCIHANYFSQRTKDFHHLFQHRNKVQSTYPPQPLSSFSSSHLFENTKKEETVPSEEDQKAMITNENNFHNPFRMNLLIIDGNALMYRCDSSKQIFSSSQIS